MAFCGDRVLGLSGGFNWYGNWLSGIAEGGLCVIRVI